MKRLLLFTVLALGMLSCQKEEITPANDCGISYTDNYNISYSTVYDNAGTELGTYQTPTLTMSILSQYIQIMDNGMLVEEFVYSEHSCNTDTVNISINGDIYHYVVSSNPNVAEITLPSGSGYRKYKIIK